MELQTSSASSKCPLPFPGPAWDTILLRLDSGPLVRVGAWKTSWNLKEKRETRRHEKEWNQDISLIKVQFYYSETRGYEEGGGAHSRQIILGVQLQVTTCSSGSGRPIGCQAPPLMLSYHNSQT